MLDYNTLKKLILEKATSFGFLEARVSSITLSAESQRQFKQWLEQGFAGDMHYLEKNTHLRFNPTLLHAEILSIICVKIPYLKQNTKYHKDRLLDANHAYVSSYALGRDYHKIVKNQLKKYAEWTNNLIHKHKLSFNYRAFTDSAPIMEVELASQAGLGWRGKNTLLLSKNHGSMFFLGELFTNLPLIADTETTSHCGSCRKCLDICPTKAFVDAYTLDASKCISYLTIENKGSIPKEYRKAIGNRIYGCDDCQLFCPWNKFSQQSPLEDFSPRNKLDQSTLLELFSWSEENFLSRLQGSPIYRIGYEAWQRNLAVGLGNAPYAKEIVDLLKQKLLNATPMVAEHINWALNEQLAKSMITKNQHEVLI